MEVGPGISRTQKKPYRFWNAPSFNPLPFSGEDPPECPLASQVGEGGSRHSRVVHEPSRQHVRDGVDREQKVAEGELKLSQLAQVQAFLKVERKDAGKIYSPAETLSILSEVQGRSTRETERTLLAKSPALQARRETAESVRVVTPTHTELKIVADPELLQLLEEARGLLAHSREMNPSLAVLFKKGLRALVLQKKKEKGIPDQNVVVSLPAPAVVRPEWAACPA
mgnify:CR=1 FL=1